MSNQLRLHLIECSMKDACDLVHALLANLGSAQAALSIPPPGPEDGKAANILKTCQQLTHLLAGAVEIARRDACSDMPRSQSVSLSDLLQLIASRISDRYSMDTPILGPLDFSNVSVQIDPETAAYALERISDDVCEMTATASAAYLKGRHNGANATIALRWIATATSLESTTKKKGVANLESALQFQPGRKYAETMATCRALLARQGVEIDVGADEQGWFEVVLVLPARLTSNKLANLAPEIGTPFAEAPKEALNPADWNQEAGRKRSGKMIIQSAQEILNFPRGIIGFADEHQFVLIRRNKTSAIGWLQSAATPHMALPVVSAHVLVPKYPDVDIESYAEAAGLGENPDELAVLVVLNAPPGVPATVNLVAPIIVNATTRKGAQLLLEGSRFTTREIFMLPGQPEPVAQSDVQAATTAAE